MVRSVEEPEHLHLPGVRAELVAGDRLSCRRAAEALNRCDVAVIQHEYGIYGGPDGDEVLEVMEALSVPTIVVLHTVLANPSPGQREVLEAVMASADAVVTMTDAARARLLANYSVDPRVVVVIPHGAAPALAEVAGRGTDGPRILTWGLLGPGKGIEWAVEAMASLRDVKPTPHYLVAGETHPKVVAREGEKYREGLSRRAEELGISHMVRFDATYRPTEEIPALIASADIVLLPYDSTEQVTSGVLVEAVAAGRPVVATEFPHAVELLSDGVGVTVPHKDPAAIAAALRELLTSPDAAAAMQAAAAHAATSLSWSTVAGRYLSLAQGIRAGRIRQPRNGDPSMIQTS